MLEKVIIAGFGGQGVMLMGRLLAYAGMLEGKNVAWMPSYGPEMRGGTANCTVIISSEEIASPVVPDPMSIIAMNKPSLDKFEPTVQKDGLILVNSSLVEQKVNRDDVSVVKVPANEIANELGNTRVANMVALGAYIKKSEVVKLETIFMALEKALTGPKQKLIDINKEALKQGTELVKE